MKKIFAIVAITALALVSCYIPGKGAGSITFVFPGIAEAKAIGDTTSFDTARVYLLSAATDTANAFLDFGDGAIFADVDINPSDGTATVEGIPAGDWDVLLALGSAEGAADTFYVQQYGNSNPVSILPGIDNQVDITISPNPFFTSTQLFGTNLVGVEFAEANIYVADSTNLHDVTFVSPNFTGATDTGVALGGASINSLSEGNALLYINTSDGVRGVGGGLIRAETAGIPVLDSGYFLDGDEVIYYQRDGGLGGVNVTTGESVDVDLSSLVSGQPVFDFEIAGNEAFFVSKLGSFSLDKTLLDGSHTAADALDLAVFFDVIGGSYYNITSLGYRDSAEMYVGTTDGIFRDTPNGGDPAFDNLATVPNTPDTYYDLIEVSESGGYVSFFTNLDLHILRTLDDVAVEIPFYAGLPGTISGLSWLSDTELLISGSEGLVLLDVSTLSF